MSGARQRAALLTILVGTAVLAACTKGSDGTVTPDDAAVDANATSDAMVAQGIPSRGVRYCELLFAYLGVDGSTAQVWGTQGLNECPAELWDALDRDAAKEAMGATAVIANGPRYWTIDSSTGAQLPTVEAMTFSGLAMQQLATVAVDPATANQNYTERVVDRTVSFRFDAGKPVYELTSPEGAVYVMQSYALIVDPSLTEADLPKISARLTLPDGWSYSTRVLDEALVVETAGDAVVIQDDLKNTYSRYIAPTP